MTKLVLDASSIERTVARIAHEILERNRGVEHLAFVGIQTRGVILADRVRKAVEGIAQKKILDGFAKAGADSTNESLLVEAAEVTSAGKAGADQGSFGSSGKGLTPSR